MASYPRFQAKRLRERTGMQGDRCPPVHTLTESKGPPSGPKGWALRGIFFYWIQTAEPSDRMRTRCAVLGPCSCFLFLHSEPYFRCLQEAPREKRCHSRMGSFRQFFRVLEMVIGCTRFAYSGRIRYAGNTEPRRMVKEKSRPGAGSGRKG